MKAHHSTARLLVIGAGPAGLTAADAAARQGLLPLVLEQGDRVGGIARTEVRRGYRFDIGGHRFFTKVPEVDALWRTTLGDELRLTPRLSRIFYDGRFYRYPLEFWETFRNLGLLRSSASVLSYSAARLRPRGPEENFEQWVTHRFGRRLYETFFKTYTEKVWGIPCHEIRAEWAAQRIQDFSLGKALREAIRPNRADTPKTLIRQFQYPRLGPGMMWEAFQERIHRQGGSVLTGVEVVSLQHDGKRVTQAIARGPDGTLLQPAVSDCLSTMAIDDLVLRLDPPPPAPVVAAARGLRHRDFVLVGLVLRRVDLFKDNWIYVHSPNVRVGRIQNFGNWSADMVPDPTTSSLGLEYFCNCGDDIWGATDEALIALATRELGYLGLARPEDVAWGTVIRQSKAYPVYDGRYREHLDTIRDWLRTLENLQTIGRNGQHRYNNQDHSMLTGLAAVDRLRGGNVDPWEVNVERSYHEDAPSSSPSRRAVGERQLG